MAASHASVRRPVEILHTTDNDGVYAPSHVRNPTLTPPDTPTRGSHYPSSASEITSCSPTKSATAHDQSVTPCERRNIFEVDSQSRRPLDFSADLDIERQVENGRPVEFGRGVWSAVYKATSKQSPRFGTLTPPASPVTSSRILAVKMPLRNDAAPVLTAEAKTLSRISAIAGADEHVVPFHGYIPATYSIVMSAIPLSLSSHIETCATRAKESFSTRTMLEPVLSIACWKDLAAQLIRGLDWLHSEAGTVHGDIKPHNILLRSRRVIEDDKASAGFQYEALFADFSSAHPIRRSIYESDNLGGASLSALTPPFAAPELMTVAAMRSGGFSTPASDVFSLALTLLAAATGDLLLYPGTSSMQRLAMSREGHRALDFVRAGPHGTRVVRNGLVEKTVAPAVVKDASKRITPSEWLRVLNSS